MIILFTSNKFQLNYTIQDIYIKIEKDIPNNE